MTYKLDVAGCFGGNRKWVAFLSKHNLEQAYEINNFLRQHNGVDCRDTSYIEFETEEDALAFRLAYDV